MTIVGVLALQGAFAKHIEVLKSLNVTVKTVRRPEELVTCDALVIPGGESTTMLRQMQFIGLTEPLRRFAETKPILGTCAGLILLAHPSIGALDVSVNRNGYGPQYESFSTHVDLILDPTAVSRLKLEKKTQKFPAIFIRAPRIKSVGDKVEVLATFNGEPILVQQGHLLGATFHPELTPNPAIHRHFLSF